MLIQVYNLSSGFTDKYLRKIFEPFGTVLNVKVSHNQFNGRADSNGLVKMLRDEDGEMAIQLLHRSMVEGKIISVSPTD